MKHAKRVRKNATAKAGNPQSKMPTAFDQSRWDRDLSDNLEDCRRCFNKMLHAKSKKDSEPMLRWFAAHQKLTLGFVEIEGGAVPKVVLEGRWLEEAGYKTGDVFKLSITTHGAIDLTTVKGGVRWARKKNCARAAKPWNIRVVGWSQINGSGSAFPKGKWRC